MILQTFQQKLFRGTKCATKSAITSSVPGQTWTMVEGLQSFFYRNKNHPPPKILTNRLINNPGASNWGTVFKEIIHHFFENHSMTSNPLIFGWGGGSIISAQTYPNSTTFDHSFSEKNTPAHSDLGASGAQRPGSHHPGRGYENSAWWQSQEPPNIHTLKEIQ